MYKIIIILFVIMGNTYAWFEYKEEKSQAIKELQVANHVLRLYFFSQDGSIKMPLSEEQLVVSNGLIEERDKLLKQNTVFYLTYKVKKIKPGLSKEFVSEFINSVVKWSQVYDFDPELVLSVCLQESQYDVNAIGPRGSVGLCQINPKVWLNNLDFITSIDDLMEIDNNVRASVYILDKYRSLFPGSLKHTLVAYNRGPFSLKKALRHGREVDPGEYYIKVKSHLKRFKEII